MPLKCACDRYRLSTTMRRLPMRNMYPGTRTWGSRADLREKALAIYQELDIDNKGGTSESEACPSSFASLRRSRRQPSEPSKAIQGRVGSHKFRARRFKVRVSNPRVTARPNRRIPRVQSSGVLALFWAPAKPLYKKPLHREIIV